MDDAIAEKRVFTRAGDTTDVFVAAAIGVVAVAVSGDRVGEFGVVHRCSPRAMAAAPGRLCVATDTDVLVSDGEAFEATGFGPAVAVAVGDGVLAGDSDGRIARYDGDVWSTVGTVDAAVRAIAGDLVATSAGVYRLDATITHAGLSDVRDVATDGRPLAATGDGLYALGNGWMRDLSGAFRTVGTDGERAHAATAEVAYERAAEGWAALELPTDGPPVGFAYGGAAFGVTADGTLLVDDGGGFRPHPMGVPDVVGIACPG